MATLSSIITPTNITTASNTQTLTNKTLTSPTLTAPVLGIPASGTVTNLTGTASININGTVGATTAAAGSFTTVSATGASTFTNSAPSVIGGLSFRNRIINGDMRIDQRNEGASVTASSSFPVDRWTMPYSVTSLVLTAQRSTTAPTGFLNSTLITASTGASAGAAETVLIRQNCEGQNTPDFLFGTANAKTITVSFWVRSSLTGTYCATIKNSAQDRSYVAEYTINAANTFEYKTITVAGDTSGTWLNTNGIGVRVEFDLGSGTNFNATANTWTGSNVRRTTNQVNWCGTSSRTFYLTGVQLEVGDAATEFERREYGSELIMCQRYFEKSMSVGTAITSGRGVALALPSVTSIANGDYYANFYYKVKKRSSAPTNTTIPFTTAANTGRLSNNTGIDYGASSAVATGGDLLMLIQNNSGGTLTVASGLILGGWTSSDEL